ncbi:heparinase II/III domain-containing protein [Haloferula sp.]|uniref:heparinase II/III domain-containing protein n=1 Tax=Haloferula sp. TaxID=2497595 RepID=UPI00329DF381
MKWVAGFLVLGITVASALKHKPYHDSYTGFELPLEVTMPEKEVHPSLWFSESDIAGLSQKKDVDAFAAEFWKKTSTSKFLLVELPPIPGAQDEKNVIHGYYGTLTQAAMYNAFMSLFDTPKKQAYLDKAIEALERGYDGPLYELDPLIRGSAVDEIYQGVWAQNFAAAYDWVQPKLTEAQDQVIRGNLTTHAAYMNKHLFSWASSPHNHISKPGWGLATMALLLSSEPEAETWLRTAIEATNANTRYFFGGDGIYREGSHYYMFSMLNFMPFLYHYRNTTDFDPFPTFQPAFEWPLRVRNGKGWMPNQEDSFIRPFASNLVAGAYKESPTRLHSSASLGSVLHWNFLNTDLGPFDASESRNGFNYTGATWDYPKPLIAYLTYDPGIKPVAPDVEPTQFLESGQTAFRTDWEGNNPKHRYLLFQGVAEADNHQHFDHLSFIMFAENQMMSSDGGYTRKSYAEPMRTEWYLTAEAHNVVIVDGKAPEDIAPGVGPYSTGRITAPGFASEKKTAIYKDGGTHSRIVSMIEDDRFALVDVVKLPLAKQVDIVMHGGRASLEGDKVHGVWNYEADAYGPACSMDQWFLGKGYSHRVKEGELTYIKNDYAAYPYFVQSKTTDRALAMHLLEPRASEAAGRIYEFHRKSEDTLVVQSGNEWHLCNVAGKSVGEGAWDTDALYGYIAYGDGGFKKAGLVEVMSFESKDEVEIVVNAPCTMFIEALESGELRVDYSAEIDAEGVIRRGEREQRLNLSGQGSMTFK